MVDGQCTDQRAEKADGLRDQSVSQRNLERELEHGSVQGRQPDREPVVHEIGREPDHPHHQGASQIERAEEIGQGGGFVGGGHDRLYWRQRRSGRLLRLALDQRHRGLGLGVAAVHREPARGFRQQAAQREREQRRQRADDEHVLPAEMRHDPQSGEACRHQADREHELVQQHETPAALRLCQLADEDGGDRHLAAEPDALDGAQH